MFSPSRPRLGKSHSRKPFDHTHYMPVLRCKKAEKDALQQLPPLIRSKMTPLIEIPRNFSVKETDANGKQKKIPLEQSDPRIPQLLDERLHKTCADIAEVWFECPVLLDLQHLCSEWRLPDGRHPVEATWHYARNFSTFPPDPVPVVNLHSDAAFLQAIRQILAIDNVGVALRIKRSDLERPWLNLEIGGLLNSLELQPHEVDFVVDYGCVGENELALQWMCSRVPRIEEWRTFTCVSSSFPQDLMGMELGQNELPRHEWNAFHDLVQSGQTLPRLPTFGDYATQFGSYVEPVPNASVSASIRYTIAREFVVMRGQSLRKGTKYLQYPANAFLLCEHPEFRSLVEDCDGDDYIQGRAERMLEIEENEGKGAGNPTKWLQASFNRHLSVTTQQISNLFGV